ncbi:TerB family tellurite resistance protein [candidate division KSB1 bacterium]|nr:TerB family tellurite resistance protein [candidate division KSB1 bacterium]
MDFLKRIFETKTEERSSQTNEVKEQDIRIATCALFLEMVNIDGEFSDAERESIMSILKEEYDLSEEHALELSETANKELQGSIDLWRFTNLINENYSEEEKIRVVELLWKLLYADGKVDEHEDYLVRKLASLLRLSHKKLIEAKLRALED